VYFLNSTQIVLTAVAILTIAGSMAAHCLARYRFRLNRTIYFILFSTIIFPPQITIISLYQILVQYGLYNSKLGLTLVYVAIQLPLTIYILESFFARIPADLFDAARMDGYSDWEIFWRVSLPIAVPAVATTVILNFILLWNEFLYAVVLITQEDNRTLPLGIQRFIGDTQEDVGMIATGLMIAIVPVIVVYAFFSERLIQGMTAGAVK
jgi:multiple sugar transport system permease protein/raffinose/stachyose/melibiose transport system permease protein